MAPPGYLPEITPPGEPDPYDQFLPASTYSDYPIPFIVGFVPTSTDVSYVTQVWDPSSRFPYYTDLPTTLVNNLILSLDVVFTVSIK